METARARAARQNAQKSTGPKSAAGKAKVAQNAFRHGFSVPLELNPNLYKEIERFAKLIIGPDPNALVWEAALEMSEAHFDLRRIDKLRNDIWQRLHDGRAVPTFQSAAARFPELRIVDSYVDVRKLSDEQKKEQIDAQIDLITELDKIGVRMCKREPDHFAELLRLERYRQRAFSRYRKAAEKVAKFKVMQ